MMLILKSLLNMLQDRSHSLGILMVKRGKVELALAVIIIVRNMIVYGEKKRKRVKFYLSSTISRTCQNMIYL